MMPRNPTQSVSLAKVLTTASTRSIPAVGERERAQARVRARASERGARVKETMQEAERGRERQRTRQKEGQKEAERGSERDRERGEPGVYGGRRADCAKRNTTKRQQVKCTEREKGTDGSGLQIRQGPVLAAAGTARSCAVSPRRVFQRRQQRPCSLIPPYAICSHTYHA